MGLLLAQLQKHFQVLFEFGLFQQRSKVSLIGILNGSSEESDHVEEHLIVLQMVDVV